MNEEDSHLIPCDRGRWTVVAIATTRRNPFRHQLLDPGTCPIIGRHILEDHPTPHRRHIATPMLGPQQEDRHLISTHYPFWTISPAPTAARDPFGRQLFDP